MNTELMKQINDLGNNPNDLRGMLTIALTQKRMSMAKLAGDIGISMATLRRFVDGSNDSSLASRFKMAQYIVIKRNNQ